MQLVQQPVNEGAVTGISQHPVSYYMMRYFSGALKACRCYVFNLCICGIRGSTVRDAALTDTRDWLRTVTKWTWLPQWCDAQFICQTNYTQMPHSLSCVIEFLQQAFFYFCRTHCSLLLQRFERCRGSLQNQTYIWMFAVELIELQRHTLSEETA